MESGGSGAGPDGRRWRQSKLKEVVRLRQPSRSVVLLSLAVTGLALGMTRWGAGSIVRKSAFDANRSEAMNLDLNERAVGVSDPYTIVSGGGSLCAPGPNILVTNSAKSGQGLP